MKLLGFNLPFGPEENVVAWRKSALEDPKRAARQLATLDAAPAALAMSSVGFAKGDLAATEVSEHAKLIIGGSVGTPEARAELALVAAVGPTLARTMLGREKVRERWDAVIALATRPVGMAAEVPRGEALRLAREVQSPQGVALRKAANKTTFTPNYDTLVAQLAPDLSPLAVAVCLANVPYSKGAHAAVRMVAMQHLLRDLFRTAGEEIIRPLSVKQVLASDELLFDAFDLFLDANDQGLGALAAMTDAMNSALQGDGDINAHTEGRSLANLTEQLRGDVARMLEWHEALYDNAETKTLRATAEKLLARLSSVADEVTAALAVKPAVNGGTTTLDDAPEFAKGPCSRLLEVCSKSKPEVDVGTIETIEELIRVMHREATAGYSARVEQALSSDRSARRGYTLDLRCKAGGSCRATLNVSSGYSRSALAQTPMGKVGEIFKRYIETSGNGIMHIDSAVLTDKSFNFDVVLGEHIGRLNVTYDRAKESYTLSWALQEPIPFMGKRTGFCRSYFRLAGFNHSSIGWRHTASRTVGADEMPRSLAFMLFSLENMRDVDIAPARYKPEALKAIFDSWYNLFEPAPVDLSGASTIEDRVARVVATRPHLFRIAGAQAIAEYQVDDLLTNAVVAFVTANANVLFDGRVDGAVLTNAVVAAMNAGQRAWQTPNPLLSTFVPPQRDSKRISLLAKRAVDRITIRDGKVANSAYTAGGLTGPTYQYTSYS